MNYKLAKQLKDANLSCVVVSQPESIRAKGKTSSEAVANLWLKLNK